MEMIWAFCCTLAFWKHNSLGVFNRNKYASSGNVLINCGLASGPSSLLCGQQTFLSGGTLTSPLGAEPHQKRVSTWDERQAHDCFLFSNFLFGFCFFLSPQAAFRCILNVKVILFRIFRAGWACTAGCIGACLTVSGQLLTLSTNISLFHPAFDT